MSGRSPFLSLGSPLPQVISSIRWDEFENELTPRLLGPTFFFCFPEKRNESYFIIRKVINACLKIREEGNVERIFKTVFGPTTQRQTQILVYFI